MSEIHEWYIPGWSQTGITLKADTEDLTSDDLFKLNGFKRYISFFDYLPLDYGKNICIWEHESRDDFIVFLKYWDENKFEFVCFGLREAIHCVKEISSLLKCALESQECYIRLDKDNEGEEVYGRSP